MPATNLYRQTVWSGCRLFLVLSLILCSLILALTLNTAHAAQVTLAWNKNVEENVVGYNVYYGTSSGNYDWLLDVGNATSFTLANLSDGRMYYFAVTAYDDSSPSLESTYSNEVSKSTCTYSISPTNASFSAAGDTGSVSVATQAGCTWTASSSSSWMTITSGSSGTGNGTIYYSVPANTTADTRTASSTFAKNVFMVTQSGTPGHTITASTGLGGTITPSGSIVVAHGASQTFNIASATGYQISNVTVDGTSVGTANSYTFSNVTSNHTIAATFSVKTYTINASAGTGGSISPNGSVSVNHGANQSFTISPNVGYQITNVTVDSVSQGPISSYTFNNVTANHTIAATFSVKTYTINASADVGGTISPAGSVSVNHGSSQPFTITANPGYTIANVLVDGGSVGVVTTYTFTNVSSNHTISATFTANTYTITASAGSNGAITPSGTVTVAQGASQIFNIAPATGYQISNVTVDSVSQGPISSYTFSNVTANHTIAATFSVQTYTITASAGTGGTISPNGSVSVNHGANQSFTISPNVGYQITNVTVDSVSQGPISSYTFNNVTANHTISASFAINTYTVNATAGTGGSISPSGAISVSGGANQTFTITANSGYLVADVIIDGSSAGPVTSYTFTNVTAAHTISATFTANTYTITSIAGSNGTISPAGSVSVNHRANQSFTITANAGYTITDVIIDGSSVGPVSSYTFNNVTANHTIAATFSVLTNTISASVGAGGTISPSGSVAVNYGANQTFTLTASPGYTIASVLVDGQPVGTGTTYTFSNVTAAHTISATFTANTYTIAASAGPNGTIAPSGAVAVNHGASKSFTITANSGYLVADVIIDGSSVGVASSYTFSNVTANHTIAATFSVKTYTITASAGTGGTISPSGSVSTNHGASQTFNIAAATGYQISNVTVDGTSVGTASSYTFSNVTANHTINVTFSQITYTITASAGTGGSISPAGAVTIAQGANQTFTLTTTPGYTIASVLVDGQPVGTGATYTFTNVTTNHTINASFAINTYTVSATAGTGGVITPSGSVSVTHGSKKTFSISANTGYTIADVLIDGASVGSLSSYTFNNVEGNHTIAASFSTATYTISASAGTGGLISPSGAVAVNHGASQSFTITANTGYQISNVTVDGTSVEVTSSYTFSNVTANHTIAATFSVKTYTINASAGTGGSISPAGSVSVNHGASKSFTITANAGYQISNVTVDGTSVGTANSYTFSNVTVNHTINVTFSQITYTITASAGTGGSISPAGAVTIAQGANQTFTFAAGSGYVVSDVVVNGASVGALSSYTFTNVSSNHSVSVSFAQGYVLNITKTGTGSGEVTTNPSATVFRPGTKVTLKAMKADSSLFGGFSGDCKTYRTSCTIVMNKTANVTAAFKLKRFIVRTKVTGDGVVSVEGSTSAVNGTEGEKPMKAAKVKRSVYETMIDYGDQLIFRIMPESGNYTKKVALDYKSMANVEELTINGIKRNHNVTVKFESKAQYSKNAKLEPHKDHIFLRDEEEKEELQTVNDLAENDINVQPINESSSASYYASVKK